MCQVKISREPTQAPVTGAVPEKIPFYIRKSFNLRDKNASHISGNPTNGDYYNK